MARQRDPLAPLEFIVYVVSGLFVFGVVAFGLGAAFSQGTSLGAFGAPSVCATYSERAFTRIGGDDTDGRKLLSAYPQASPSRGSYTGTDRFRTCDSRPTTAMTVVARSATVLDLAYVAVVLALLVRLVRTARRRGLFAARVARQVSTLGWFLLLGSVAYAVAKALLEGSLAHLLVRAPLQTAQIAAFDLSLTVVIVAFGLLTLGRVMTHTVRMRDEIDATV